MADADIANNELPSLPRGVAYKGYPCVPIYDFRGNVALLPMFVDPPVKKNLIFHLVITCRRKVIINYCAYYATKLLQLAKESFRMAMSIFIQSIGKKSPHNIGLKPTRSVMNLSGIKKLPRLQVIKSLFFIHSDFKKSIF